MIKDDQLSRKTAILMELSMHYIRMGVVVGQGCANMERPDSESIMNTDKYCVVASRMPSVTPKIRHTSVVANVWPRS